MSIATKTEQRRNRIKRGTSAKSTLAAKADARAAIDEVRTISNLPHTDHGANTIDELISREEIKQSMASDEYQAPNETKADDRRYSEQDPRYVPMSMLLEDLRRRVRTWTRGYGKTERSDIATDAALILMRWTKQGAKAPICLGPVGAAPLRREWFDADKRTVIRDGKSTRPAPNDRANKAMRAAILQAAAKRNAERIAAVAAAMKKLDDLSADDDRESTRSTLASEALRRDQETSDRAPSLPDTDAPQLVAQAMGITLSAARTIVARGWRIDNSPERCADLWQVSPQRAKDVLSAGKREIHKRYGTSAELLDALQAAAPALRELLCTRAYLAMTDLRDAPRWADKAKLTARAESAVNEWRAAMGELPATRRAIELAAQRVGWAAESNPTESTLALLTAAMARAERDASVSSQGSHLAMVRCQLDRASVGASAKLAPVSRWRMLPLAADPTQASRSALYARCAADDRMRRDA